MIQYLKENGYPFDMVLETTTIGRGYHTKVTVDGELIQSFEHILADSRKYYAMGFISGWLEKESRKK